MPGATLRITPMDTVPTGGSRADTYSLLLKNAPDSILEILVAPETADLLERMRAEYQLDDAQQTVVTEFLRDVLLGIPTGADMAGDLASRAGIGHSTALQIIGVVEKDLLGPVGMSLADIGRTGTGPSVSEVAGRIAVKYATIDDLMRDIDDLPAAERMRFLQTAKRDNRILVLKALSQLRLGTDSGGRPLPFAALAAREADDFSASDWIAFMTEDPSLAKTPEIWGALVSFLSNSEHISAAFADAPTPAAARMLYEALMEALPRAKPTVVQHVRLSPYFAGIYDKDTIINETMFSRWAALPDAMRLRLLSAELSERIASLIDTGTIPENFGAAVAKIVFLVAIDEVRPSSLGDLLGRRLGLGSEKGSALAQRIVSDLLPLLVAGQEEPTPPQPSAPAPPAEPASSPASIPGPEPEPVPPLPPRPGAGPNVVDLRKRP